MENVIKIFKQIQETSGKNDKQYVISVNSNNELFKECLVFLLDSQIVTGISKAKIKKRVSLTDYITIDRMSFLELMEYVKDNNTGRDSDLSIVQSFIDNQQSEHREFYEQMITKSLKLGVDSTTVNKAIPDLIKTWELQQAYSIDKYNMKNNEWFSLSQKLNGCFIGDTNILMKDGSKKKIKDIGIGDEVLSFDENTKTISCKRVVNVYDNGFKNKNEWLSIRCDSSKGQYFRHNILVTKNHKIFTEKGWISANDIQIGDKIYTREYVLSDTQISVLIGIGLGDSNVIRDNPDVSCVRFSYPKKIDGYNNFLHNTVGLFDVYEGTYHRKTSGYGTKMENGNIKTISYAPNYLSNNDNILRAGYTFTDEILRNITPLALALFYIDDGSKSPCTDDGNIYARNKRPRVTFATHRHNKEDVERFSKFLYERYLITNRIKQYNKKYGESGYQIELDVEGTETFFDLIAKYIPYDIRDNKLSVDWHNIEYEDWTKDFGEYQMVLKTVDSIVDCNALKEYNQKKNLRAYDLEIEDNHTYFADGIAVHNCHGSFYKGKLISRQGKEIKGLEHIIADLDAMGFGEGYFIDGELIRNNIDGLSDGENFRLGTGIINSDSVDKSCIHFIIYEVFPIEEFDSGESKLTYKDRLNLLNEFELATKNEGVTSIETVERLYEGNDTSKIDEWLDYAVEHDWEGCMLNRNTTYRCLRNNGILKIKRFYTMDLPIVDIVEGDGRLKNTLGAIVVDFKGNTVNVGSGYSDEQREQIWNNRNNLIGRIIEVKYKEITSDKKTGLESLQFPTFVMLRELGKNISYD